MAAAAPARTPGKPGRAPATTHGELSHLAISLFLEQGYEETTIDDIVRAAGIGRRTFFRYFPSKNDLPWGDFDGLLRNMRDRLTHADPHAPLIDTLQAAILDFNTYPAEEIPHHRNRMWLLLHVPSLMAYSTLRYADWRRVIAEYIAVRYNTHPDAIVPQTISWTCLSICLSSYEQWLAHPDAELREIMSDSFSIATATFRESHHHTSPPHTP